MWLVMASAGGVERMPTTKYPVTWNLGHYSERHDPVFKSPQAPVGFDVLTPIFQVTFLTMRFLEEMNQKHALLWWLSFVWGLIDKIGGEIHSYLMTLSESPESFLSERQYCYLGVFYLWHLHPNTKRSGSFQSVCFEVWYLIHRAYLSL